jgi:hypothetical protein
VSHGPFTPNWLLEAGWKVAVPEMVSWCDAVDEERIREVDAKMDEVRTPLNTRHPISLTKTPGFATLDLQTAVPHLPPFSARERRSNQGGAYPHSVRIVAGSGKLSKQCWEQGGWGRSSRRMPSWQGMTVKGQGGGGVVGLTLG